jgi:Bacterial Ig-like domain (group 2)
VAIGGRLDLGWEAGTNPFPKAEKMANWIIIQRTNQLTESYFESGTGFQGVEGSATGYATKELTMADALTQRQIYGQGARLVVKDTVSGMEFAVPVLSASPYLTTINVSPAGPAIAAAGGTCQMTALGINSDGSTVNLANSATWASGTPGHATISPTGLVTGVAAGTSTISASQSGVTGSTTATMS